MTFQRVHTAIGLFIWAFIWLLHPSYWFGIASFFVIVLGSTLPDIDLLFQPFLKHRGIIHTVRAGLVYSVIVALAASWLMTPEETVLLALLALISFVTHLLFDGHLKF